MELPSRKTLKWAPRGRVSALIKLVDNGARPWALESMEIAQGIRPGHLVLSS